MSNSGNYGKWKLRAVQRQFVRIEAGQIGRGAASTNDNHHIEKFGVLINCLERTDNGTFSLFALHYRREKFCVKGKLIFVVAQLIYEIVVTSCCGRRNYGQTLWQQWHLHQFVHVGNAIGFELTNDF